MISQDLLGNMDIDEDVVDEAKDQFLTFAVANEIYGVGIDYIKEIIKVCNITKIPHSQNYLKGIINLRGDIIPVIDVRTRFQKEEKLYDELTCIIVIEFKGDTLGLIVDEVREVMFIYEKNIIPPPDAKHNFSNRFIKNLGKTDSGVKLIIDLNNFVDSNNL